MSISIQKAEDVLVYAPESECVVLLSPPGTGKSFAAMRAARRMGAIYLPVYAATMEAIDARGLPYLRDGKTETKHVGWAAPSFLPLELELERYKGETVLVNFDDWFQAPPPVLRATVRSIYGDGGERRIGDFPVYSRTRFVATGNREEDRAGVYRPETYVNDRITYLEIEPSVDDWASAAIGGFAMPAPEPDYAATREKINKEVAKGIPDELVAYVKWGKQVYDFSTEQRSFLSPRSIERLGKFLRAFDATGINGDILFETARGTVGETHATKFLAFRALRDELPDTEAILRGEDVHLPVKAEVLYILCSTIIRVGKKEHSPAVAKLVDRIASLRTEDGKKVGVEISAYLFLECLRGAAKELRGVREHPLAHKWLRENGKYFT